MTPLKDEIEDTLALHGLRRGVKRGRSQPARDQSESGNEEREFNDRRVHEACQDEIAFLPRKTFIKEQLMCAILKRAGARFGPGLHAHCST